jgi:hypothetical protein
VRETPPPVAITLIFTVEAASGEAAVRVMTTRPWPGAAMLVCESEAVTPEGNPLTDRFKAELNPPPAAVRTVKAAGLGLAGACCRTKNCAAVDQIKKNEERENYPELVTATAEHSNLVEKEFPTRHSSARD